MINKLTNRIKKLFRVSIHPRTTFHSRHYLEHNRSRLEHLESLSLNLNGQTVLEVGAGIGDLTPFFLDRGCQVTALEGRRENLEILKSRYPEVAAHQIDMDQPPEGLIDTHDIVFCYGLLYHLHKPAEALEFMARNTGKLLLLSTCVSYGDGDDVNIVKEYVKNPSQALSGLGCRPTRNWIFNQLKKHFEYVYMPATQPNHPEFPTDWIEEPANKKALTRSVFIASRSPIDNPLLLDSIPMKQEKLT